MGFHSRYFEPLYRILLLYRSKLFNNLVYKWKVNVGYQAASNDSHFKNSFQRIDFIEANVEAGIPMEDTIEII